MKRKILLTTACVATAVSVAACSGGSSTSATTAAPAETTAAPETTTQAAETLYTAGTYSASEQGFGGPVTVTITVSDSEITDVAIEGEGETPTVGGAAFDTLKQAILDAQSEEIDAVAGATITSEAVKKAAASAISQALPLSRASPPPRQRLMPNWHLPQELIQVQAKAIMDRLRSA